MANPLQYIEEHPQETKEILGIEYQQWLALVEVAKNEEERTRLAQEAQKIRINKKGGGRPKKLTKEEEICLCIFYLRHLVTFKILGMQFNISKTEANDTFNYWIKIIRKILPASLMEEKKKEKEELEVVKENLIEYELIVDSWEQPRERPEDNEEQKEYYSGKKKQHTYKSQLVTLPKGEDLVDVVVGKQGKASDINIFREQQKKFNVEQKFTGDKGYQGGINIKTPQKKPRGKELTESQKEGNKEISSQRIYVENVIRLLKIFRAAKERFRMKGNKYEQIILTICGLVRLRIGTVILSAL
jgi:DDE superfamily endonuclease/Helix-turn-helix of DDE superfamily endonuclease